MTQPEARALFDKLTLELGMVVERWEALCQVEEMLAIVELNVSEKKKEVSEK